MVVLFSLRLIQGILLIKLSVLVLCKSSFCNVEITSEHNTDQLCVHSFCRYIVLWKRESVAL